MSNDDYNPFLKRLAPQPTPSQPEPVGSKGPPVPPIVNWNQVHAEVDSQPEESEFDDTQEYDPSLGGTLPFQHTLESNERFSKWFWSFASAAFVTGLLVAVIYRLVVLPVVMAPGQDFGVTLLIAGGLGAIYGVIHATWRMRKLCTAIHIDEQAVILSYGRRHETIDPLSIDALMTLSGIDLNGEGRGFSNLRQVVMLRGATIEKLSFEPISNARIFVALREACLHAWAIPAEGTLLPPLELSEQHADRAGIDSLRRLRKHYGAFVMRLTFSSVALIVLLLAGGGLVISTVGIKQIRAGMIRMLIFSGGLIIAALSSLRRLPREFAILRKIKETEKSLAVALGIDFAR